MAEIGNQRRSDAGLDAGGRASCQGSWGWGGGGAERLLEFRLLEKARKCILLYSLRKGQSSANTWLLGILTSSPVKERMRAISSPQFGVTC